MPQDNCTVAFCLICGGLFTISLLVFTIAPYGVYNDLKTIECNITRIEFPENYPTHEDTTNWNKCDCGRYCTSWYPCVKLYTEDYPDIVIKDEFEIKQYDDFCTFYESNCPNGENAQNIIEYMKKARSYYDNYINTTVECYIEYGDSGVKNIYLEKEFDIGLAVLNISMVSLCCIYFICSMCCSSEPSTNHAI